MSYLKYIDGLRALAVILVVLYHGKVEALGSGFIGVDIFFVISGFLITSILMNRNLTLLEFYRSRIKRILPAYVVLFISVSIISWFILLPEDYIQLFKSIRDSIGMISNILFMNITSGYFATSSYEIPLLHTWSLSIEWQFYLFWPLIIILIKRVPENYQFYTVGAIFLISVAVGAYQTPILQEKAYYVTYTRIPALILGGLICFIDLNKFSNFLSYIGFFLIVLSLFIFPSDYYYPGLYGLLPILGAALVIYGLNNSNNILTRTFESKIASNIGLMSYSIYLWHWPILSFIYYLNIDFTVPVVFTAFMATLMLSYVSYNFIEVPFRNKKYTFRKFAILLILIPLFTSLGVYYFSKKHHGWPSRIWDQSDVYMSAKKYIESKCNSNIKNDLGTLEECTLGITDKKPSGILIGDSHAGHFKGFVDNLAKDAKLSILSRTYGSCMALMDTYTIYKGKKYTSCSEGNEMMFSLIKEDVKYVFIAQRWIGYNGSSVKHADGTQSLDGSYGDFLDETIRKIINKGARPILLGNTPEDGTNYYDCFAQHIKQRRNLKVDECILKLDNDFVKDDKLYVHKLFSNLSDKYPELIILDINDIICGENAICPISIDNIPVFTDTHHLSEYASIEFAKRYLSKYGNPLLEHDRHGDTTQRNPTIQSDIAAE